MVAAEIAAAAAVVIITDINLILLQNIKDPIHWVLFYCDLQGFCFIRLNLALGGTLNKFNGRSVLRDYSAVIKAETVNL